MNYIVRCICCMPLIIGLANAKPNPSKLIDKVRLNLSAQRWVKTSTAKVKVTISATLINQSLVQMRKQIMLKLNTIAKGEWHITQFNRSLNTSGLETLFVSANARIEQSSLTNVNTLAKQVSQPGIQYKISNIDFSPSQQDIEKVEIMARHELYKKINKELVYLNNEYKDQKFSLYSVVIFKAGEQPLMQHNNLKTLRLATKYQANNLSVSSKLTLSARVILASNRNIEKNK